MSLPSGSPPRTPPRFVPTLTERVDAPTAAVLAETTVEPAGLPAVRSMRSTSGASLEPVESPTSPVAPVALAAGQKTIPPQQVDNNFAARMAALRDKNGTALETAPWLARAVPRTSVNALPRHSPLPVPPGDDRVARAAPTFSGVHKQANEAAAAHSSQRMSAQQASEFEVMLVHRVLQRVDMALDQQLRDVIASVVQAHATSLLPNLRDEVEGVVRRAVNEAVSAEFAAQSKSQ